MKKQVQFNVIKCKSVDDFDDRTFSVMLEFKRKGLRRIATGAFAEVRGSKTSRSVFKINTDDSCDSYKKDPYLCYVQHVIQHQDNPFFPRIKSVTIYTGRGCGYMYVVEMERLHSLERGKRGSKVRQLPKGVKELLNQFTNLGDCIDTDVFMDRITAMALLFGRENAPIVNRLKVVMNVLGKLFPRFSSDMHDGNIMLRGKTQLVITDPIA